MSDTLTWMGIFDKSTEVAAAIDELHTLGIPEKQMVVMTGVPYPEGSIGRHREWLALPYIVLAGAIAGLFFGLFLSVITPHLYRLDVGGHPAVAGPPAVVITFVFTMMATIVSTFLGVLWEMNFPRFGTAPYHRLVTDGYLAVLLEFPAVLEGDVRRILESHQVNQLGEPERMLL